ncbi:hypothetical protein NLG97_g2452 [Lecanicillium saksenae]|uniref:Uncharacterized protein n=1 Tax=Lecanicillium saksenae TaxID=468837 RepID=A0ACC1R3I7_9HYPO|nr:hypothetical protein NLG97_g2452 [Lecanicillium saksenae]
MSSTDSISILLIHGAWHGPWCWKHQIPELEKIGYTTETVHLPSTHGIAGKTQFDDSNAVRSVLQTLLAAGKRVVVVAHSYGGPIGSAAIIGLSERERSAKNLPGGVIGYIALCAFIFPGGMDQGAAIDAQGGLPYVSWDAPSRGLFVPKDPRSMFFPPDVPQDRVDWAVPQLSPQSSAANTGIVPPQMWQDDVENYTGKLGYIICTDDVVVPVESQKAMIDGAGAAGRWITRELQGAGHSPFLSRPHEVASVVHELAQQFMQTGGSY